MRLCETENKIDILQALHYSALIKTVHFISVTVVFARIHSSSGFVTFVANVVARANEQTSIEYVVEFLICSRWHFSNDFFLYFV